MNFCRSQFLICNMGLFFLIGQHLLYLSRFYKRGMISTLLPREEKLSDCGVNTFHFSPPLTPASPEMKEPLGELGDGTEHVQLKTFSPHICLYASLHPQLPLWFSCWRPAMTRGQVLGKLPKTPMGAPLLNAVEKLPFWCESAPVAGSTFRL